MASVNWTALIVFTVLFAFVAWLGFAAARWRKGDLNQLHEWGLGGGRFGTLLTWFLVGGDLYTAYTFIAIPALAYGAGAMGFFAVPFSILAYPILFMVFPPIWRACRENNCLTLADLVQVKLRNRWLALAVAVTGIVATLPYIALQLIGLQVVIGALGLAGSTRYLPLLIAFAALVTFTYKSGLRAPASIAIVKDILIYVTVFAAIIYIPVQLGGFGKVFDSVPMERLLLTPPPENSGGSYSIYATLALGSAMAFLLYPHAATGLLSAGSTRVIRRNAALLPCYGVLLGMLVLMGYFALAAGVADRPEFAEGFKLFGNNFSVPALFLASFPPWFVGVAFAAIGIGAVVPAAIMAIACGNLYTLSIHREYLRPDLPPEQQTGIAKKASLVVTTLALLFVLYVPTEFAVYLQLLGGIWIIQTLPAVLFGLFVRWFNPWALLAGWAVGSIVGTLIAVAANMTPNYTLQFGDFSLPGYTALYTVVLNIALAALLTPLCNALGSRGAVGDAGLQKSPPVR